MKKVTLALLLTASLVSAEVVSPREARVLVRQPYGTNNIKVAPDFWMYDGFRITGDIFFYKMIVPIYF